MNNVFDLILQTRKLLIKILDSTSREDLLKIPEGYRNNIWWNIAHTVVTQQILTHKLSGTPMHVPDELVAKFKKGTVPDGTATDEEIAAIRELLISAVEASEKDYKDGLLQNFNAYPTSTGIVLENVDFALAFNVYHEGLHMSTIMRMRKMLSA